jgi:hypothetical protein
MNNQKQIREKQYPITNNQYPISNFPGSEKNLFLFILFEIWILGVGYFPSIMYKGINHEH